MKIVLKYNMSNKNIDPIIALFSSNKFQDALNAIEELIVDNSNDALLFNIRGACYAGLGQKNLAKENYEKAILVNPEYAKAHYNLAGALHELNDIDASIKSYQDALAIEPDYAEAHNNLGNVYKEVGQLDLAVKSLKKAISIKPDYVEAYYSLGSTFYDSEKLEEAVESYSKVVQLKPSFSLIHNNLGNILRELGRFDEAILSYEKAISIDPDFFEVYYNLGITFQDMKDYSNSVNYYKKSIENNGNHPEAHNNLGVAYKELKEYELAIKSYDKAIDLRPDYADAHNNLGLLFKELGQVDKAIISHEQAIHIQPDHSDAHFNLGMILFDNGNFDAAIACYRKAIKADTKFTEAYNNLGVIFLNSGFLDEAKKFFENASIINPKDALAFNNLGIVYQRIHNFDDSVKCFEKAISINPSYIDAFSNFGNVLTDMGSFDKALTNYQHAYELNSSVDYLLGNIIHTKMHLCIWDDFSRQLKELEVQVNDNLKRVDAFSFMALSDNPRLLQKVSKLYAKGKFPKSNTLPDISQHPKHNKIRVGYFSGDFREHPVSTLTAGLYESHNRKAFEVHAFSFGPDTNDKMNLRIKSGVDHFHDVQTMSHKDIALLARSLEIDIAVDLGGFTASGKTDIFAMSAAPIQLSYIGFLGTMGAPYYDYLIADPITIPKESQRYYTEKIAYLPIYQVNDSKETLPEVFFTREDIGLPETGFVFCCFNNTYKITPDTFDIWMRILKSVEDSVLLIYVDLDAARENLMNEASLRAIDPSRLIFAKHFERYQYLARYRVVDLFLDTLPYNAATTASDALRMGLPVLTCRGESFASRMAASVISAVNLPELITNTPEEYESLAIELAINPQKFKVIKDKLHNNLSTAPLFDTTKFTENLESVYSIMYQRYQDGLEPDHIYIDDSE